MGDRDTLIHLIAGGSVLTLIKCSPKIVKEGGKAALALAESSTVAALS